MSQTPSSPLIHLESVTKTFGPVVAVNNVSFDVGAGEIVGFLGPNGAGKSTTLKMISTFLEPTAGRIAVAGADTVARSLAVRQRIGYLSGDTPLYQDMRVDRFLKFIGRARGLAGDRLAERAQWCVDTLGLHPMLKKRVNQCSTGFRQRIGLATALIHDPDIIILDEPTHGFDPLQVLAFRDMLQGLKQERAILFSSHIIQEVQAISDRVLIINQGDLLGNGTLPELKRATGVKKDSLEDIFVTLVQRHSETAEQKS